MAPEDILHFWFDELSPKDWWRKSDTLLENGNTSESLATKPVEQKTRLVPRVAQS